MDFTPLTPQQRQSFDENGFLVVPNALDKDAIDRLLEAGDRQAETFLKKLEVRNKPWYNDLDLRSGLLAENPFYALVSHATTVPLIVQLLSPNIHLHSTSLVYKHPEDPDFPPFRRGWHRDMRIPKDLGHAGLAKVGIKVCYCLTELQAPESGMTLMVPKSHLRTEPLNVARGQLDPVDMEVCDLTLKAGDAVLFENRIFHTATLNRSDRIAKRVIYGYAYRWMKPEVYLDVPEERYLNEANQTADPITYQLLGGYRDIDTSPWALQQWAVKYGVAPKPFPWTVEIS